MFISDAFADAPAVTTTGTGTAAPAPLGSGDVSSPLPGMLPLLFILPVLYFLMIRPNQKRIREYETMVKALRRGDRIVTGGGVIGVISKIENDEVLVVEIAPDVKIRVMRDTISNVINKTAVNDNKVEDKSAKKSDDHSAGN